MVRFARSVLAAAAVFGSVGCGGSSSAKTPSDATCDVEVAGRTTGAAAKTGAVAVGDSAVQVGSTTVGLVQDGTQGAKARWKERGAETKQDARENAAETKREANRKICR